MVFYEIYKHPSSDVMNATLWFLGMFGTYVFPVLALGSQKLTGNWMSWNVDSKSRWHFTRALW